jgi:hypothetical protein
MKYLVECYARAENEGKPNARKRGRGADTDVAFNQDRAAIISQCKMEITNRAR